MKTLCKNCKHGEINFWGYNECYKFDEEIDLATTKHTANREKHALKFNTNLNCEYYEPRNLKQKILDKLDKR